MNKLGVFLGGVLLASLAPAAHANIQISFSVNGGASIVCANSAVNTGPISCSGSSGSFTALQLSASSNSPGTAPNAHTFDSSLQLSTTADGFLDVWFAAQDFSAPVTPPALKYSGSTSATSISGSSTVTGEHCIDTNNSLSFCTAGFLLGNPPQVFSNSDSGGKTNSINIASLAPPFSMQEHLHIVMTAGSEINVILSSVLTPVPEPMSIALLGGVVLLTSGAIRRKRNQGLQHKG